MESGEVYQPLAWTPREAYRFLQDIPELEEAGLIVRVPDWWKAKRPPRPRGQRRRSGERKWHGLGADALLDFPVGVAWMGERLSDEEDRELCCRPAAGWCRLKGQWVEVDREKLAAALEHWKRRRGGQVKAAGCRSSRACGCCPERIGDDAARQRPRRRCGAGVERVPAGGMARGVLAQLRDPQRLRRRRPGLQLRELRPYQQVGCGVAAFLTQLRPGGMPGRRHGPGQDDPGAGAAADMRLRRAKRRDGGDAAAHEPCRACWWCRRR